MNTFDSEMRQCDRADASLGRRISGGLLLQLAGVFVLLASYALPWIDMRPLASSTISGFGTFSFSAGMVLRLGPTANLSEMAIAFEIVKAFCILFAAPILAVIGGVCVLRNKSWGRLLMALAGTYFLAWCGYDFIRHGFSFKSTQLSGVVGFIASLVLTVPFFARFEPMKKKMAAVLEVRCVRVPSYVPNVALAGMVVFLLGGIGVANFNLAFSNKQSAEADVKAPPFENLFNRQDAPPPPPPLALGQPAHPAPGISVPRHQDSQPREFIPVIVGGDPGEAESLRVKGDEFHAQGNYYEAARLYERSAEMGDLEAQVAIAVAYDAGKGVPQNTIRAAGWYRYAAEHGHSFAQYAIGQLYRSGDGVPKDLEKGNLWLAQSADQGDKYGLFELGRVYEEGDGVERDYPNAYELYLEASEKGNKEATRRLKALELKLSQEDREVIDQRLASQKDPDYEE